jgi:imidazole glycerol-phosphate synthase
MTRLAPCVNFKIGSTTQEIPRTIFLAERPACGMARPSVHLLDYGAGNVASIRNAIRAVGFDIIDVESPDDLATAKVLVFPGVGAFGSAMAFLSARGYVTPLREYIASGRPFVGICIGMQTLFESSEESPGVAGLGIIPGAVEKFPSSPEYSVPHIGWNGIRLHLPSPALAGVSDASKLYFVHSYRVRVSPENTSWVAATTDYGDGAFISAVQRGAVFACQFHPEKSGAVGLELLRAGLAHALSVASAAGRLEGEVTAPPMSQAVSTIGASNGRATTRLAKRIIA